jgi:hypothetical protein
VLAFMTSPCLRRIRVTGTGLRHARYDPELNLEARMSEIPPEIDISRPHPARIYDFFLGGKDNFTADREAAAHILRAAPFAPVMARENRAFLGRAVRFLAGEAGIRQFLDIGTGLPTTNNVHEAAQAIAPASRVVYVDNDPLVRVHASALLVDAGETRFVTADLRDPDGVLNHPQTRELIDFAQPVGLLMTAVLFDGLELVPPYEDAAAAVTYVGEWGAEDPDMADSDGSRWSYGGVARRP